jgi:hypothetical protein
VLFDGRKNGTREFELNKSKALEQFINRVFYKSDIRNFAAV